MKRMEGLSATDVNGSRERFFKVEPVQEGQDNDESTGGPHVKHGAGGSHLLSSCSAKKTAKNCPWSRSGSGGAADQPADSVENRFEYGITKQVEITIVEERSDQPDRKGSPDF